MDKTATEQADEERRTGTRRAWRAHRFADTILHLMQDFVPRERDCLRRMHQYLFETGFNGNIELINVPPECDAVDKLTLERWRRDASLRIITPDPKLPI